MIRPSIVLIILFFSFFIFSFCSTHCDSVKFIRKIELGGKITKKSKWDWNRGETAIYIHNNFNNGNELWTYLDKSGLYDYVQIGDSLYKFKNSFQVNIYREDSVRVFYLDYPGNCE